MQFIVRELRASDSLEDLTSLLQRAYKELADAGLNFTASYQTAETTARRCADGHCFVVESEGALIGTAVLKTQFWDDDPTEYQVPGTGVLGQFGVDPAWRGRGVGSALLAAVEERALRLGLTTLALDTAEPAKWLVAYYERNGFRAVGRHQWNGKTYSSLVMAKPLA